MKTNDEIAHTCHGHIS